MSAQDYSTLVKKEAKAESDLVAPKGNTRTHTLMEANKLVTGDRNTTYGEPDEDFRRTATYWNTHLNAVLQRKLGGTELPLAVRMVMEDLIDTWDVAIMMTLLKTSRLSWSPQEEDHWIDSAGYSACGAECVERHFSR